MKIKKIMTGCVGSCSSGESIATAVEVMWKYDCGAIPVVEDGKPLGMVTDRDIAVAVTTRNILPTDISVNELAVGPLISCFANDHVKKALKTMAKYRVRRLPVIDKKENLVGIITVTDILRASEGEKKLRRLAVQTLMAITKPHNDA